jgi:Flp pilus assembly protein TadD
MFDAASRFDAASAEPQIELARLFIASGDKKLALVSAKKATKLAPESSAAWNTLGRAQLARFAYDDAITAFEKALDLNPKNAYAWNNLGFTNLELELYSEARNALEEATALPEATGYMFNNLGLAYEHLEMFEEARTAFEQGGEKGSAAAKYNRGRLEGVEAEPKAATVVISPDVKVIQETGQVEESEIVDEAVKAQADEDAKTIDDTVTDESNIDDGTDVPDDPVDDAASDDSDDSPDSADQTETTKKI